MMKKKKRNPNLSKYDAPLRIQFERGMNAFKGKQYIKNVKGARREAIDYINGLFKTIKMNTEFNNWNETLSTSSNSSSTCD